MIQSLKTYGQSIRMLRLELQKKKKKTKHLLWMSCCLLGSLVVVVAVPLNEQVAPVLDCLW
jgi:hypothetical protein